LVIQYQFRINVRVSNANEATKLLTICNFFRIKRNNSITCNISIERLIAKIKREHDNQQARTKGNGGRTT